MEAAQGRAAMATGQSEVEHCTGVAQLLSINAIVAKKCESEEEREETRYPSLQWILHKVENVFRGKSSNHFMYHVP